MPRIRSIKPGFWQDQRLSRFDALTRLVYICLWSMADDDGRVEGDAETVWHFGFPREKKDAIEKALGVLSESSRIVPYTGGAGQKYLFLPKFSTHQKINRPSPSQLPPPPTDTEIHGGLTESSPTTPGAITAGLDGIGMEGKGEDRIGGGVGEDRAPSEPSVVKGEKKRSPAEAAAHALSKTLGSSIAPCRNQIAALTTAGWDLVRISDAIKTHAVPGMAPWDWTKAARGESNGKVYEGYNFQRAV